jgi:PadR family transcriptional regulator, regulatory protein AphA
MTTDKHDELRLTPPSFIVLGLLATMGEATPYDLKSVVASSVGNFWSVQHAQIYAETARLTDAGLLSERREETGRRRRFYALTAAGERTLAEWLRAPTADLFELRDLGLLKLYFGADPRPFARARLPMHERKLAEHEERVRLFGEEIPSGVRLAIEAGIGHEREWVRYWKALIAGETEPSPPLPQSEAIETDTVAG